MGCVNLNKKMKKVFVGAVVCLIALVGTGCSNNDNGISTMNIQSNSEKKFNKMVVQIDDKEEIVEGIDGGEISKNLINAFELPMKDTVKVKVTLKQKGKNIVSSEELELNLKKKKDYSILIEDVSKDEVVLKIKKN